MNKFLFSNLFIWELNRTRDPQLQNDFETIQCLSDVSKKHDISVGINIPFYSVGFSNEPDFSSVQKPSELLARDRSDNELKSLIAEIKKCGLLAIVTLYNEVSVELAVKHDIDIVKIDCWSFSDWPLLEKIVLTGKPVFATLTDSSMKDISRVHFFFNNRKIAHVFLYAPESLFASAIKTNYTQAFHLKNSYPGTDIGICVLQSTKSASIVQKVMTNGIDIIDMISTPGSPNHESEDASNVLLSFIAQNTSPRLSLKTGEESKLPSEKPIPFIHRRQRGLFSKMPLEQGTILNDQNTYFSLMRSDGQITANMFSKHLFHILKTDVEPGQAIETNQVDTKDINNLDQPVLPEHIGMVEKDIDGIPCIVLSHANLSDTKWIIHVHGGGYVSGSASETKGSAISLAINSGCNIIIPDYRIAPRFTFPAPIEDVEIIYNNLTANVAGSNSIGFFGESAGGGISLAVTMKLRDSGKSLPGALACSSPWADLTNSSKSHDAEMNRKDILLDTTVLKENAAMYAGTTPLAHPYLSPIFGDFSGFPPTIIYAGKNEILIEDSRRLSKRIKEAGGLVELNIVESMPHAFTILSSVFQQAKHAMTSIGSFFQKHLGGVSHA